MTLADDLRRLGFKSEQIATATIGGKPLAELIKEDAKRQTAKLPPTRYDLRDEFCAMWDRIGPAIKYRTEYRFHKPRRWKFDVAWPDCRVAVELEGGIWTRGRHTRGKGYRRDMEKYNAASMDGWTVLRYCANDIRESPVQVVEEVARAMGIEYQVNGKVTT
jgi:very-short-patch-repair endonuclease